jgi:hypothetical protein
LRPDAGPSSSHPFPSRRNERGASSAGQQSLGLDEGHGLSTPEQEYDPNPIINEVRGHVARWRAWPNPSEWQVIPDYITLVDDGHGDDDLLHLIIEIKGYRREDAKDKKATTETYWVPGVNNLGTYGRWAFAEFRDVYEIEAQFGAMVEEAVSMAEKWGARK